jgi:hypothetical protein
VQIVAEVSEARKFWALTPAEQERVLAAVQQSGARVVIATWVPQTDVYGLWQPVEDTEYAKLELSQLPASPSS